MAKKIPDFDPKLKGTLLSRSTAESLKSQDVKPKSISKSVPFKFFIGLLVLIMFVGMFKSYNSFLVDNGTVLERSYNVNVPSSGDSIDMSSFYAYNNMTVPLPTFSDVVDKLGKLDKVATSMDVYSGFEDWSKTNTPELYEMKFGNFWQKAVWEVSSIFTRIYYRIAVKLFGIGDIVDAIIDLFT